MTRSSPRVMSVSANAPAGWPLTGITTIGQFTRTGVIPVPKGASAAMRWAPTHGAKPLGLQPRRAVRLARTRGDGAGRSAQRGTSGAATGPGGRSAPAPAASGNTTREPRAAALHRPGATSDCGIWPWLRAAHVVRHVGDHHARVEQQRRLQPQRRLVVEQVLPPVRRHELRQHHVIVSCGCVSLSASMYASSGPASERYGDSTITSSTPGSHSSHSRRSSAAWPRRRSRAPRPRAGRPAQWRARRPAPGAPARPDRRPAPRREP